MKNRTLFLALGGLAAMAFAVRGRAAAAAPAASSTAEAVGRAAPSGADSPNAAERLQAAGIAGGNDAPGADLLSPEASADAKGPGLGDFFRGA